MSADQMSSVKSKHGFYTSYIQHFVGFLLCMCVSVFCDCCVQVSASLYFWSMWGGGLPPGPPMPGSASVAVHCVESVEDCCTRLVTTSR